MDLVATFFFVAGLILVLVGAESLVRGAVGLASAAGVSPLVIGLTVVAFGTSSPELAVSLGSAWAGRTDLAIGNVVGSNICNVLLILGIAATMASLPVSRRVVRLEVPIMVAASVMLMLFALDGRLGRPEGVLFAAAAVVYTVWTIRVSRRERPIESGGVPAPTGAPRRVSWQIALVVAGLILLQLGSTVMVRGATFLARWLGVDELVIGLTVIALGTSLPEIATSVVAGFRGERDIAVGNVVGSNLFNILIVLGLTATLAPGGLLVSPAALRFDMPVMIAVAVACLPIFFTGYAISRKEGVLFLAYYGAYLGYLFLASVQHRALPAVSFVMLAFVLPLTVITLVILSARALKRSPSRFPRTR